MTPERKKYLANISKEERVIRDEVKFKKRIVSIRKLCVKLSENNNERSSHKQRISDLKTVIKALKKQLPAPRKEISIGQYWAIFNCPICRTTIPIHSGYCLCCGQKLR